MPVRSNHNDAISRTLNIKLSVALLLLLASTSLMITRAQEYQERPDRTGAIDVRPVETGSARYSATTRPQQVTGPDQDQDGLSDADELTLKTDPANADSDCDYIDDGTEVGSVSAPTNPDGDALISALENNRADSNGNTSTDDQDPAIGKQVTCGRFLPFAILNNGTDTTRIEVRVGGNVTAVSAIVPFGFTLKLNGADLNSGDQIPLFDDGTNGDQRSGDGLWTRNGLTSTTAITFGWSDDIRFTSFQVTDGGGTSTVTMTDALSPSGISLGLVDAADAVAPALVRPNVWAASNLVNVVDPLGSLHVKGGFDTFGRLQSASQSFYTTSGLGDQYDFILYFTDAFTSIGATAFYTPVKNDIQNIGKNQFDVAANYGSSGKLQGVMVINFNSNGPTLHELAHRWAAPDLSALGFHQCNGDTAHWGVAGVGEGQLGGFDPATLVDNGNGTYTVSSFGTFANGGDSVNYAPIELYLAGFIEASAVPDMIIPTNVDCGSITSNGGTTTFAASGLSTVTIGQVQAALGGTRNPGVAGSQKSFTTASVVVSQYQLNSAELAFYNEWSKQLGAPTGPAPFKTFAQATGGVGAMDTTISFTPPPPIVPRRYLPLIIAP